MQAIHNTSLPPSGQDFAVGLRLCPSTLLKKGSRNLVVARNNYLQIFQLNVEDGTLVHVQSKILHGVVTGLARVKILDSAKDGLHRLLISFKSAKFSLIEWDAATHTLATISLHSFERLPQLLPNPLPRHPLLRADPTSRCASLLLAATTPTLAVLPLFQDALETQSSAVESLPYSGSFLINLSALLPALLFVHDYCFLPGFNEPTVAVLYSTQPTWTGRLEGTVARDSTSLLILTLDLSESHSHAIISNISPTASTLSTGLPYDARQVYPCPKELGGLLVVSGNAVIHVDQAGKIIAKPFNAWHDKTSNGINTPGLLMPSASTPNMSLENCSLVFTSTLNALLFLSNGAIFNLLFRRDGRTLSEITIANNEQPIGTGTIPSCAELVGRDHVFVGSIVGSGALLKYNAYAESGREVGDVEMDQGGESDSDSEEDDLYGASESKVKRLVVPKAAAHSAAKDPLLRCTDSLEGYGAIRDMAVGAVADDSQPELVACTGGIATGGLTVFHRGLSPRKKRRLDFSCDNIDRASLSMLNINSKPLLIASAEEKTSYFAPNSEDGSFDLLKTDDSSLIACGALFDGSRIVQVTKDSIRLLDSDNNVQQTLLLGAEPAIIDAEFADPYILVKRSGGGITIYQGDETVISPKPLSLPVSKVIAASIHQDLHGAFPVFRSDKAATKAEVPETPVGTKPDVTMEEDVDEVDYEEGDADLYDVAKSSKSGKAGASIRNPLPPFLGLGGHGSEKKVPRARHMLFVQTTSESFEIISLPDRNVLFTSSSLRYLPAVLEDSILGKPKEPLPPLEDSDVEQISCTLMGGKRKKPFLTVLLRDGSLAVYEAVPDFVERDIASSPRRVSAAIRFVRVARHETAAASQEETARIFRPICLGSNGLLLTCPDKLYCVLASDHGPPRVHVLQEQGITHFAAASSDLQAQCAFISNKTLYIASMPPLCLDSQLPWSSASTGRAYSAIAYDQPSNTFVATSVHDAPFELFDDDGQPVWRPDNPDLLYPQPSNFRCALELLVPGTWECIDGHEFRQNEISNSMKSVTIQSQSSPTGYRDFIGVGTSINKGEDISVRGALYIFEIVNTVHEDGKAEHSRKIRLRFMEEQKSEVSNIWHINGYLLHSMGLKLYAKGFDQDERLLAVAFLDIGVHVTSIRTLKNLILLGDIDKGITFIAFQEEPFKLVAIGKDYQGRGTITADFLVHDGKMSFVTTDVAGVVRIIEYNPANLESRGGERLLCRTEFQGVTESAASIIYTKRTSIAEPKQSGILHAGADGSLQTIAPMRDAVYKRLQLLERQLQRYTQHYAGLNPRALRTVPNYFVSRALSKGMLDGDLLANFDNLHALRQQEMAIAINSDVDTIRSNLLNLKGPW